MITPSIQVTGQTSVIVGSAAAPQFACKRNGIAVFDVRITFAGSWNVSIQSNAPALSVDLPPVSRTIDCNGLTLFNNQVCVCPAGYVGSGCSAACPVGRYRPLGLDIDCTACDATRTTLLSASTSIDDCICTDGYYSSDSNAAQPCTACPSGATCTNNTIVSNPGSWAASATSYVYYNCSTGACVGGLSNLDANSNADVQCTGGRSGPICSLCLPGYGLVANECVKCSPSSALNVLFLILTILGIAALVGLLVKSMRSGNSTRGIVAKIFFNYVQVIAFVGDYRVRWSGMVGVFFSFASSSIDLRLFSTDCATDFPFYTQLILTLCVPPILCVAVAIFIASLYQIRRACGKSAKIKVSLVFLFVRSFVR